MVTASFLLQLDKALHHGLASYPDGLWKISQQCCPELVGCALGKLLGLYHQKPSKYRGQLVATDSLPCSH